jgi:ectoine hydroxylase-related dioxygenase (phytanoyl-CoA dioxygenase family)
MDQLPLTTVLTQEEVDRFNADGFLVVENAVTPDQLSRLQADFVGWVDEARTRRENWGEILDGRARFDLAPGHSAERPLLRRVAAPSEVSAAHYEVMTDSPMVDAVAQLIGANVKHHHNKTNSKLPGSNTEVRWHQDFPFTPHTNSNMVTALLMLDDVHETNGALEVAAGSHKGPIYGLWHDGIYTGAMDRTSEDRFRAESVRCMGKAGSVCLMHTRLAHGSEPNQSDSSRTLYICVYSAGDAHKITHNPVPNTHDGLFVRGSDPGHIRCEPYEVAYPEYPRGVSFFTQQSSAERGTS